MRYIIFRTTYSHSKYSFKLNPVMRIIFDYNNINVCSVTIFRIAFHAQSFPPRLEIFTNIQIEFQIKANFGRVPAFFQNKSV